MKISSYGVFPDKKKVAFAQPVPTHTWMKLHQKIFECCLNVGEQVVEYYFIGNWVTYISLAPRLTAEEVLLENEVLLGEICSTSGKNGLAGNH